MTGAERVAVLLTCHDRKAVTLACLERVRAQKCSVDVRLDLVVVDDGSTDGTAAAIRERFPEAEIIPGSGALYWNGGMRLAFEHAMNRDYDYYLMLNDDTQLGVDAIETLLATYRRVSALDRKESIIVGSTNDPTTGTMTYGGWRRVGVLNPADCVKIAPSDQPQRCDTMNGNCVLVPRVVAEKVGNLDAGFTHGMGDFDLGFRAKRAHCSIWAAPGFVGACAHNPIRGSWRDLSAPSWARWKRLVAPKGLPPKEWLRFTSRHSGLLWPLYWLNPYVTFWWNACKMPFAKKRVHA